MGKGWGASGEGLRGRCVGVVTYVQMGGEGRSLRAGGWRGRRGLRVEGRGETQSISRAVKSLVRDYVSLGVLLHVSRYLLLIVFIFVSISRTAMGKNVFIMF